MWGQRGGDRQPILLPAQVISCPAGRGSRARPPRPPATSGTAPSAWPSKAAIGRVVLGETNPLRVYLAEKEEVDAGVLISLSNRLSLSHCRVPHHLVCPPIQGSPVLSLSELSKAPLHNGPPAPLPAPEGSSSRLSPPNVSALLDISLPGPPEDVLSQGEPATHISDSIIEIAISSGQYGEGPWGPHLPLRCLHTCWAHPCPSSIPS